MLCRFLVEDELLRLGAIFEKVADWQPFSVVDGRLVTGRIQRPQPLQPRTSSICSLEKPLRAVSQLRGLIKIARSGFPWEKTTKRSLASVYTNCETA